MEAWCVDERGCRAAARGVAAAPGGGCGMSGPGLAVQAEIKTGERRVIQYLLSPISKAMDEAGRER